MATLLRILRGQTTDLIEKNHPLEFTRSFSPTHFHPRIFTHLFSPTHFHSPVFTHHFPPKKVCEKWNSYTMSKLNCHFSPTFSKNCWKWHFHPFWWVKMQFSRTQNEWERREHFCWCSWGQRERWGCIENCFESMTKIILTVTYLPPATHMYRFVEICDSRDTFSNLHGFELHRPSSKGSKLLLQV